MLGCRIGDRPSYPLEPVGPSDSIDGWTSRLKVGRCAFGRSYPCRSRQHKAGFGESPRWTYCSASGGAMANFILDSYAVLAPLTDDVGTDEVRAGIPNPEHHLRMRVVNLGQVHYVLSRTNGGEAAEDAVRLVFEPENVDVIDVTSSSSKVAVEVLCGCLRVPRSRARGMDDPAR